MHRLVTFQSWAARSIRLRPLACAALLIAAANAGAQTRPSLDQLQAQILALQSQLAALQSQVVAVQARTGSAFVRWGNATAPAGTTLIHGGAAFSGHFQFGATGSASCLASGALGPRVDIVNDPLYPASTYVAVGAIPSQRRIKCAVVQADRPTVVVWSDAAVPAGWQVLYRGYAYGAYYGHASPLERICVDRDNFDGSEPSTGQGALYFPSYVFPVGSATAPEAVPCAVWMKS